MKRKLHNFKCFIQDIKEYNLIYAINFRIFYGISDLCYSKAFKKIKQSRIGDRIDNILTILNDKVENTLDAYDGHLTPPEEPNEEYDEYDSCIHYWSCEECPYSGSCDQIV